MVRRSAAAAGLDGDQSQVLKETMKASKNQPAPVPRKLSPAAERALAEAAQRRSEIDRKAAEHPKESPAREREPTRYGDWERKGLTSDF